MNNNLTELILVCDRSGSMSSCREEAQNGINRFIKDQKDADGEARLTLVQFDDEYDVVHDNTPIEDVPEYELQPRSMTALLDAVGKAVNTVGERLSKTKEEDRPGLVVCVIATDGHENASKEYKMDQVAAMVKEQSDKYNWEFQFLGANIDAFAAGGGMGIKSASTTNFSVKRVADAYQLSSEKVTNMRGAVVAGQSASVHNLFSDEERTALED